jgi:hypothetical protein
MHAVAAQGLAGQAALAVDRHPAFLADAHAAQGRTPLAADRGATATVRTQGQGGGTIGALSDRQWAAIQE